ncbi:hypothetical protein FRC17_004651 [Serendipita sp. 399]|nr:hypothetical protein FRC17_004651 [Serendipita sp. 399]
MNAWSAASVISQFPTPPSSTPSYVAPPQQPTTSCYNAPTIISLGEEYTDETLPRASYLDFDEEEEEEEEEESQSRRLMMMMEDDGDSDDEDSSDESEEEDESDSEDYPVLHTPSSSTSSHNSTISTSPTRGVQSISRSFGPRGPRPRLPLPSLPSSPPSPHFQMTGSPVSMTGFRDEDEEDEAAAAAMLSNHLSEARSARAQERQKRRRENERIRELSMLLTLGSEVRKWEERLAWTHRARASTAPSSTSTTSDDLHLQTKSEDTDPDPRVKRLSRSASLPSRAFNGSTLHHHDGNGNDGQQQQQQQQHRSGPPSPALPSLALSPLWRVSAEMILRRRSLSERPRRTPIQVASGRIGFVSSPVTRPVVVEPTITGEAAADVKGRTAKEAEEDVPMASSSSSSSSEPVVIATPTATLPCNTLFRPAQTVRGPRERSTQISSLVAGAGMTTKRSGSVTGFSTVVSSSTPMSPLMKKSSSTGSISRPRTIALSNGNQDDEHDNDDNQDNDMADTDGLTRDGTSSVATSSLSPLDGSTSSSPLSSVSSSSGKRYSVPPPITIPPPGPFRPNATAVSGTIAAAAVPLSSSAGNGDVQSFAVQQRTGARSTPSSPFSHSSRYTILSRSAPARPSALKWAFTADDLERERELEELERKRVQAMEMETETRMEVDEESSFSSTMSSASCAASSSEESGSEAGSSSVSTSSSADSTDSQSAETSSQAAVERRGRARFSWRKSLPKEKEMNVDGINLVGAITSPSTTTPTPSTTTTMTTPMTSVMTVAAF